MYRTVDTSTWDDPKVKTLPPDGKLLWVYLITNRHTHVSGIYYLPRALAALETGITRRRLDTLCDTLSGLGLARFDAEREVVWVVKMLRYQGRGDKNARAAAANLTTLHKSPLIADFCRMYQEAAAYAPDTLSDTLSDRASLARTQEQEQEQEQETPPTPPQGGSAPNQPKPKRRAGTIGPQDQAARDLAAALGSSLNPCRKQVAALIAAGRTIEQIREAIRQHAEPGLAPWEWTKRVTGGSKPKERDQLIPKAKPPTIEDYAESMGVTVEVARERLGKAGRP